MKRHWKEICALTLAFLVPLWIFGDPPVYFAKDIRGQVVDEASGVPLEGVVVVASWLLREAGPGSNSHGFSLNTIDVVTDKEGKYVIPGWGPRPRPPFQYFDYYDPLLRFFRSNYYPESSGNEFTSDRYRNKSSVRTSDWDGKVIKLKPFGGIDWPEYSFQLSATWSRNDTDCLRSCPRLVLGLDSESKRMKALAPKEPFIPKIVDIENFSEGNREFLKRFKKENGL